jgi:hypothetical protein
MKRYTGLRDQSQTDRIKFHTSDPQKRNTRASGGIENHIADGAYLTKLARNVFY